MLDFFDMSIQIYLMKVVNNVTSNIGTEEDFGLVLPMVPALTNMLQNRNNPELFDLICSSV